MLLLFCCCCCSTDVQNKLLYILQKIMHTFKMCRKRKWFHVILSIIWNILNHLKFNMCFQLHFRCCDNIHPNIYKYFNRFRIYRHVTYFFNFPDAFNILSKVQVIWFQTDPISKFPISARKKKTKWVKWVHIIWKETTNQKKKNEQNTLSNHFALTLKNERPKRIHSS